MKFRLFRSRAVRKARRAQQRKLDRQAHIEEIAKWHPHFVIWPRVIDTPDDSAEYATRVCFETIWQKAQVRNNSGLEGFDRYVWTRHTEKEYFVKKLDGTLAPEERFGNGDGVSQGPMSSGMVSNIKGH